MYNSNLSSLTSQQPQRNVVHPAPSSVNPGTDEEATQLLEHFGSFQRWGVEEAIEMRQTRDPRVKQEPGLQTTQQFYIPQQPLQQRVLQIPYQPPVSSFRYPNTPGAPYISPANPLALQQLQALPVTTTTTTTTASSSQTNNKRSAQDFGFQDPDSSKKPRTDNSQHTVIQGNNTGRDGRSYLDYEDLIEKEFREVNYENVEVFCHEAFQLSLSNVQKAHLSEILAASQNRQTKYAEAEVTCLTVINLSNLSNDQKVNLHIALATSQNNQKKIHRD